MSDGAIDRLWFDEGWRYRVGRGLLAPAGRLYGSVAALRNALYDAGLLAVREPALPTLALGNLTVGGTGKTPMAAWVAGRLLAAGARPAVVLRGYGDDEPRVHARLNPQAIVVADADRRRAVAEARARGADCAILDDAFQHRRIGRLADWVLVAAEQWRPGLRCLPAGPLREGIAGLSRATLVVVTRKTADAAASARLADTLARAAQRPATVAHLALAALEDARGAGRVPLSWLAGRRIVGVAAVGAPAPFFDQLQALGATVTALSFPDHHAFDGADVARIVRCATGRDAVICTLKDAVKLAPRWPDNGAPLWYVSQRVVIERGEAALEASLASVLAARAAAPQTAGQAGSSSPAHGYRSSPADQ